MGGYPSSRRSTFLPSRDPPVPIDASFNIGFGLVNVQFDRDLEVGLLDPANWFVRFQNLERPVILPQVPPLGPDFVNMSTGIVVPDPGPDVVSYSPPPFDVISDTFNPTPADAFADFPLHL